MTNQTIATATTNAKEETKNRLTALTKKRNEILHILENFADITKETLTAELTETVQELCETMAQIAVYKTLFKLSDSAKDITTNGAKMCEKMYKDFTRDMATYRTHNTAETYTDAMDLFNIAYMDIWQYLNGSAPLDLDTTVYTKVSKNGTEKNYTLFQYACKSIRESIHSWSKSDNYKRLHYIIGIADNGQQVTTSKRPQDDLTDIPENTKKAFFDKYGLTAQEQEIISLLIRGEDIPTIAKLLNIPTVTAYKQTARAKAKFATASAYAEYITAKNAEKVARAKAEKHIDDTVYQEVYTRAKARTAKAYDEWVIAFHKGV
jgi:Fe2+ or Zn2+ uptake regulation protein